MHPKFMLKSIRTVLLCALLLVSGTVARNSCRQCTGTYTMDFVEFRSYSDVQKYLQEVLGICATGRQFEITSTSVSDCFTGSTSIAVCKTWILGVRVWRFCGNGPTVYLNRQNICSTLYCTSTEVLNLKCTKSVGCANRCNSKLCGC